MTFIDLTGQRFGRWLVLERAPSADKYVKWHCRCDCGKSAAVYAHSLRSDRSKSCGCYGNELSSTRAATHRESRRTPEYQTWQGIKQRCLLPASKDFHRYGGRGIRICDEWRDDYAVFLAYVGRRPSPAHTLDRVNNDGHYEPGNVRWATRREQAWNRRGTRLTPEMVRYIRAQVAVGVKRKALAAELQQSYWTICDAVTRGWGLRS